MQTETKKTPKDTLPPTEPDEFDFHQICLVGDIIIINDNTGKEICRTDITKATTMKIGVAVRMCWYLRSEYGEMLNLGIIPEKFVFKRRRKRIWYFTKK